MHFIWTYWQFFANILTGQIPKPKQDCFFGGGNLKKSVWCWPSARKPGIPKHPRVLRHPQQYCWHYLPSLSCGSPFPPQMAQLFSMLPLHIALLPPPHGYEASLQTSLISATFSIEIFHGWTKLQILHIPEAKRKESLYSTAKATHYLAHFFSTELPFLLHNIASTHLSSTPQQSYGANFPTVTLLRHSQQ